MNAAPWPAGVSAASPSSTLGADEPVPHIAWAGLCLQTSTDTRAHAACNARYAAHDAPVNEPGAQVLLCILVPVHVHAAAAVAARARGEAYGAFPPHDAVPHRTGELSRVQSRACFRMREMYARRAAPAAGRDNDLVAQPHAHPQAHGRHHSAGNTCLPRLSPLLAAAGAALGTQCARTHRDAHTPSHAHTRTALARSGRQGDTGCAADLGQVGSGRDGAMGSPRRIVRPDLLRCTRASRRPRSCAKVLCCLRKTSDLTASYNHQSQTRNSGRARRVSHLRRPAGVRPARSTHLQGPVTASHIAPLSRLVWLWPRRPPARPRGLSTLVPPLPPARPRGRFHVGACAFRAASVD